MAAGLPEPDRALLAVLAGRGRSGALLSPDEEDLLEAWLAGRLSPTGAATAEALARRNPLAAERILERRLVGAALQGPDVPPDVLARLRRVAPPVPAPVVAPPAWTRWWIAAWPRTTLRRGLALASFLVLAIASAPLVRQAWHVDAPLQVALVTLAERGVLFEPSDLRMRGADRGPAAPDDRRFRDLEVPAGLLKSLFRDPARPSAMVLRDLEALLPVGPRRVPSHVLVDGALRAQADAAPEDRRLPVRLYDLGDPRTADLRAALGAPAAAGGRLYLMTVRP